MSAYNTFIQCGGKKTLGEWLKWSLARGRACWFNTVEKWSSIFGLNSIIILLLYDKKSCNSLEKRFLEACSVPGSVIASVKSVERQNIRLNPSLLEKICLINLQHDWMVDGIINQHRVKLIDKLIQDSATLEDADFGSYLHESVESIRAFYAESNAKLVDKYSLDLSLFGFLSVGD